MNFATNTITFETLFLSLFLFSLDRLLGHRGKKIQELEQKSAAQAQKAAQVILTTPKHKCAPTHTRTLTFIEHIHSKCRSCRTQWTCTKKKSANWSAGVCCACIILSIYSLKEIRNFTIPTRLSDIERSKHATEKEKSVLVRQLQEATAKNRSLLQQLKSRSIQRNNILSLSLGLSLTFHIYHFLSPSFSLFPLHYLSSFTLALLLTHSHSEMQHEADGITIDNLQHYIDSVTKSWGYVTTQTCTCTHTHSQLTALHRLGHQEGYVTTHTRAPHTHTLTHAHRYEQMDRQGQIVALAELKHKQELHKYACVFLCMHV